MRVDRNLAFSLPLLGALLAALLLALLPSVMGRHPTSVPTSQLFEAVARSARAGGSPSVDAVGNAVTATVGGHTITAVKAGADSVYTILRDYNVPLGRVRVDERDPSVGDALRANPLAIVPWIIFLGLLFVVLNQMSRRGRGSLGMSAASRTRDRGRRQPRRWRAGLQRLPLLSPRAGSPARPDVSFADVAGADEAKGELVEVVQFLKEPGRFAAMGAAIPRGVLLSGPPGCGKTLLARAVAGEAGVPFYAVSGSEFMEMFVGIGASRVRALFARARRHAPCIVFIDEIDAIGRRRGGHSTGGAEEREHTLNQMLVELDGFDSSAEVIVIAATNRADVLDEALLRPGRFDRQVTIGPPDVRGRAAVLAVHARGKSLAPMVDLPLVARQTPGFSGADLMNLMNEAAILAVRRGRADVSMAELEDAIDRVLAGPERETHLMGEEERRVTAYHEIGHALVARLLPHLDPVHKISIISRGRMGGYTRLAPTDERQLYTRTRLMETLAWCLGGRAAEDIVCGEISTGASSDIERATSIARQMVCEFGMSERLGPLLFSRRDGDGPSQYSEALTGEVDREIQALIAEADRMARDILRANERALHASAAALIQEETIDAARFSAILADCAPLSA